MDATLKMDIYNLSDPGILAKEIQADSADRGLSSHLQYSCRHWVYHLLEANLDDCHEATVQFLEVHFLHWVESMALMGEIAEAVLLITRLRDLPTVSSGINIERHITDYAATRATFSPIPGWLH
jgi:hypothetical protein